MPGSLSRARWSRTTVLARVCTRPVQASDARFDVAASAGRRIRIEILRTSATSGAGAAASDGTILIDSRAGAAVGRTLAFV